MRNTRLHRRMMATIGVLLALAGASAAAAKAKRGSSRRCKARVAILSLEWLGPIFSGNGVYARTLAEKLMDRGACVAVVSSLPDTLPTALSSQIRSDPVVGMFGGAAGCGMGSVDRSACRSKDGSLVAGVTVDSTKWRRLGLDGVWQEFANGLGNVSGAFRSIAAFRPHVLLAVDWHGSLAAEAYHQSWEIVCQRINGTPVDGSFDWAAPSATAFREFAAKQCGKGNPKTPTVFFNFRMFSGSAALTESLSDLFQFVALEGRAAARSERSLTLSMVDSVRLVRLASITQDGLVAMPWSSGEHGWWNNLEAWSFSAAASTNGKDLAPLLRHAMSISTATQPHAASSLAETGEADGFGVLLPSLRDSIRARALLDPATYAASTQEGEMHPEGDQQVAEDAMGLYTGESAQHDQLPWVELFDRWLLDDSQRAENDDVDAWLAAHSAAFDMGAAADAVHPVEMALVVADDSLSGRGGEGGFMDQEDEGGNPPLPFETLHNDSLVVNTPTVRKRPHRFIRPKVLRFGLEVHPIHPSLSEQAMEARNRKRREQQDELNERAKEFGGTYDPMAGFRDKDGNVLSEEEAKKILGPDAPEHLQSDGRAVMDMEKDGWAKIVQQLYDRADGDYKRLLPPRWLADLGYPIDEAVPDKMLLTVRSVRSGFEGLMQAELEAEDRKQQGAQDGQLPEHVYRAADAQKDSTRRARVLAAAKVASQLQRPRESFMLPTRRLILWCSRASPEKQPLLFAKALHFLGALIHETPFIPAVCIDGPDESLNRKMEELTLMAHPNAIILSGFLGPGRMAELFARTALYVHTAEYEAYGMTPVEAAAFGVPTLAHHPGCHAGSVCVSSIAGAASSKLNYSDPTESLNQCSKRLAAYRRGETNVLMQLYQREQKAADAAAETGNEDDPAVKQLAARADRVAMEHDRVLKERQKHKAPRINGAPSMAKSKSTVPAVGSLELLKPSLGRSFGTDMTAEPWQLALAMGRVMCRIGMQPDFAEAGLDNYNFQDKYETTHDIPFRPGVDVPALSAWINVDYRARSRALRMMDGRTGGNSQEHEKMLKCRQEAIMGFESKLHFAKHVDECTCLGIGVEHRAQALPIGRGERIAAKIRDIDHKPVLEQQDEDAASAGKRPHKPLPHPGCVGLAARQAALAWTDEDSAAALMKTLVRTVKDSRKAAGKPPTTSE